MTTTIRTAVAGATLALTLNPIALADNRLISGQSGACASFVLEWTEANPDCTEPVVRRAVRQDNAANDRNRTKGHWSFEECIPAGKVLKNPRICVPLGDDPEDGYAYQTASWHILQHEIALLPLVQPELVALDLVAVVDADALIGEGTVFQEGQVLDAINGVIAATPHVRILDGSTLPQDPNEALDWLGDPFIVQILPGFTGPVVVIGNTRYGNGCRVDLAAPYGEIDFFDVLAFLTLFDAQQAAADLAEPFGEWDIFDVLEFLALFDQGCD